MTMKEFYFPPKVFQDLVVKYRVSSLTELHRAIEGKAGANDDRDLFYGALFAQGVGAVQRHECLLRRYEGEPWDIEIVNKTLLESGGKPNHWCVQLFHITRHAVESSVKTGSNNIYEIIEHFIHDTKLSPKKGDYKGGILVMHLGFSAIGSFDVRELRKYVRGIQQNKVQQIWVTSFTKPDYSEGQLMELLLGDGELLIFPLQDVLRSESIL